MPIKTYNTTFYKCKLSFLHQKNASIIIWWEKCLNSSLTFAFLLLPLPWHNADRSPSFLFIQSQNWQWQCLAWLTTFILNYRHSTKQFHMLHYALNFWDFTIQYSLTINYCYCYFLFTLSYLKRNQYHQRSFA